MSDSKPCGSRNPHAKMPAVEEPDEAQWARAYWGTMVGQGAPPGVACGAGTMGVQHGRTQAERASFLHISSGGVDSPALARPGNQGPPGYWPDDLWFSLQSETWN